MAMSLAQIDPQQLTNEAARRFSNLRSVRWRIDLGILPSSQSDSIVDLRRATADSRRRYASLRRKLLIDPQITKDQSRAPDLSIDNPLSQNPESTWGRFFRNAELEQIVDQDLTRLYPENGSYFQTPNCQAVLRRILLLWSLQHPQYGYRQGMHELLAPLVYVLHVDLDRLSKVCKLHEDCFTDAFDSGIENTRKRIPPKNGIGIGINSKNTSATPDDLDPDTKQIFLLSDPYGAEGELGVVLSERFMEHDSYCMFESLMNGGGPRIAVSQAELFSISTLIMESSSALYHLLNKVDFSLHSHLIELGVEPQFFALRWLRVLFGREFALDDLLLIWDEVFSHSDAVCAEIDVEESEFRILCSARGAFIVGLAVSMLLHLRPSLLATENVTVCLQKLLNFPRKINIEKLIEKARSLQVVSLDSNARVYSTPNRTPPHHHMPASYWEERWRVLHKTESLHKTELLPNEMDKDLIHHGPVKKKSISERLGLARTESDPSGSTRPTAQRQLFNENIKNSGVACVKLPLPLVLNQNESVFVEFNTGNNDSDTKGSASESISNDDACPSGGEESRVSSCSVNDRENYENDTDKSSVTEEESVSKSNGEDEGEARIGKTETEKGAETETETETVTESASREEKMETKMFSSKFQWFWNLGASRGGERTETKAETKTESVSKESSSSVGDTSDNKRVMGTFKNLGQSMLENIQVIESVFQQDGKGQATAMAALTELRKISNLLREM